MNCLPGIPDDYKVLLDLRDFSPENQDVIALQQIDECKAMDDIDASGNLGTAVSLCAHIWAPLTARCWLRPA